MLNNGIEGCITKELICRARTLMVKGLIAAFFLFSLALFIA